MHFIICNGVQAIIVERVHTCYSLVLAEHGSRAGL